MKERINAEIIDENLFKMLTNTEYFLSLKQDVQREVLMSIAGAKTDNELAQGNAEFTALVDMLSGKSLADYRRQIAAEKKRLKMQADEIKPRIDQNGQDETRSRGLELIGRNAHRQKERAGRNKRTSAF
jgi:hypothetical protein